VYSLRKALTSKAGSMLSELIPDGDVVEWQRCKEQRPLIGGLD
jgi:hypothetical protein